MFYYSLLIKCSILYICVIFISAVTKALNEVLESISIVCITEANAVLHFLWGFFFIFLLNGLTNLANDGNLVDSVGSVSLVNFGKIVL